jgi:hypothetical protein
MFFSPGKKMAIIMLLTILILSLLLESFTREGMDVAAAVNEDAPKESEQDQRSPDKQSSSPDGIQLPDGKKPITVSEITSILAKNQAVKDLLK